MKADSALTSLIQKAEAFEKQGIDTSLLRQLIRDIEEERIVLAGILHVSATFAHDVRNWMNLLIISLILLAGFSSSAATFTPLTDENAVRAIVGEAENQGKEGMLAVACAIRNRGHLKGVYGINSPRIPKVEKKYWEQARWAWKESAKRDITGGADHWENVKAFGTPKWTAKMTPTVLIKDHQFYRS